MATFLFYTFLTLFVFIALVMILLILIQKGRGGGLASAFGGGAGGHTAFGSKTGDVLTWATSIVFGLFLLLAIALNLNARSLHQRGQIAAPAAPPPAGNTTSTGNGPLPPLNEAITGASTQPAAPTTTPSMAAPSPATAPATQPAQ